MNKEREQREFDLLLWKSGELNPREEKLIENNLSDEDFTFISMLESQEKLFVNAKVTNVNLVLRSDQSRSTKKNKISSTENYFQMTSLIASLTALLIIAIIIVSEKSETTVDKPAVAGNNSVEAVKPIVVKSAPSHVKLKKTTLSKYRKRYLSLKSRRSRMARLNLFSRPKNST